MEEMEYTELCEKVRHRLDDCAAAGWNGTAMYALVQTVRPELEPHQAIELVDMATACMKNAPGSGNSDKAHS